MISDAILSLAPGAQWSMTDEDYSTLDWHVDNIIQKPSWEEVTAEVEKLKAIAASKEYQRQRAAEYPSFADQFDILYHGGYDAWRAAVDAVKTKYPKPE